MTDNYSKWAKRLEIFQQHETVAARRAAMLASGMMTYMVPDLEDCGFYRLPLTEPGVNAKTGQRNGRAVVIGWEPVAYYEVNGKLCCSRSGFDVSDDEAADIWTYVVSNPISEAEYRTMTEMAIAPAETEGWGEQ